MEIQMRPVREKLDPVVSRFPERLKQVDCYSLPAMDLCRDSELHWRIVQVGKFFDAMIAN